MIEAAGITRRYTAADLRIILVTLISAGTGMLLLAGYLPASLKLYVALCSLPLVLRKGEENPHAWRYALVALFFVLAGILVPVKTFFYFSLVLTWIWATERFLGRQHVLLPAIFIFLSPVFQYLADIFTFPVRMWLSEVAGRILYFIDDSACTTGTSIWFHEREFSVDPGCMGLSTLVLSFQLSLIILARNFYGRLHQLRVWQVFLFFTAIFLLNICCNQVRIVLLVMLEWEPGTMLHEVGGLICFGLYVLVPALLLSRKMAGCRVRQSSVPAGGGRGRVLPLVLHTLLIIGVATQAVCLLRNEAAAGNTAPTIKEDDGYEMTHPWPGVIRLKNHNQLIYIKTVRGFFDTDHQPMMCWKGSGYLFQQVQEMQSGSRHFYTGRLKKEEQELYTAWWYDNGSDETISAWYWRWEMLRGAPGYALVNITTDSMETLLQAVRDFNYRKLFPQKINNKK